jgi:hypothetical protein
MTLFSEATSDTYGFSSLEVNIRLLPEIKNLGPKRAKFAAYKQASIEGGFVYLDSDVVVLQRLEALENVKQFTACRDDLSECPFITDKTHPWIHFPWISSAAYFNSGVFACPSGYSAFFDGICAEAFDDESWYKVIIKDKLYDNHFLCLKTAVHDVKIDFISPTGYNWQGLRSKGQLDCELIRDSGLLNKTTGEIVRVAHFAGIRDIHSYLASIPENVAAYIRNCAGTN